MTRSFRTGGRTLIAEARTDMGLQWRRSAGTETEKSQSSAERKTFYLKKSSLVPSESLFTGLVLNSTICNLCEEQSEAVFYLTASTVDLILSILVK